MSFISSAMMKSKSCSYTIMIVAGEASGDLHGGNLVKAMKQSDAGLRFFGMGGTYMESQGVEIIHALDQMAVMGVSEVLAKLGTILKALKDLKHELRQRAPDLLILIDFADFNLRIAKTAKKLGIPVYYYITPKVWVWRKGRVKKLAAYVDRAGVILPFEERYLRNKKVKATYVGNPVVESTVATLSRHSFCEKYGLNSDNALVGLLPGSRKKEVASLLPEFFEAAKRMQEKYSRDISFLIPLASTLTMDDLLENGLQEYQKDMDIHVLDQDRYSLMNACDGVLAASGTVTLELALLDTPMVVAYKIAPLSYMIAKLLVHLRFFSLVNILADKEVVPELLQDQAHPAALEIELARIIFDDGVRSEMKKDLAEIRAKLGKGQVSSKAAELAFQIIRQKN